MTAPDFHLPRLLTCDVLYTGMGGAQSPGGVVLMRDIIAATGHPDELKRNYPHAVVEHVGGIIAPPPVNAHTHLDMSAYDFQALPYFRWIPEVVVGQREKRGVPGAHAGADELVRLKVGGVGDIVFAAEVMDALLERDDLQGVLYFELFAPQVEKADAAFARMRELMAGWRSKERPDGLRLGLTPHTPFTVSHRLLKLTAEYAAGEGLPMQIHVAEHPTELELFQTGAGPLWDSRLKAFTPDTFAEIIGREPAPDLTPVRYLDELGVLNARPTLIHMVNVTPDDIRRVARAGCTVVTCPRSNHHLECGTFKWAEFAAAGVDIALGTDSVASGESLDVREEIQFARTLYPHLDPRLLVRAAVKGGHRVLGSRAPFIRRGERWHQEYLW